MLLGMVLALSGCAGGPVTDIDPCVEIPFVDGAEGACTNTITHKSYLVPANQWAKERPKMIMIRAKDWTKIKIDWLKACRLAGPQCNVAVDSVDSVIKALDKIAGQVIPIP